MPDVPVIVSPTVMLAAVLLADNVSVLVPVLLIAPKAPVTPVGSVRGVNLTVLLLKRKRHPEAVWTDA